MFSPGAIRALNGQHRLMNLVFELSLLDLLLRLELDHGSEWEDSYGETHHELTEGSIPAHVSESIIAFLEGDVPHGDDQDAWAREMEEEYPELVGSFGIAADLDLEV